MVALLAAARAPVALRAVSAWNPVTDIDHWRQLTEHPRVGDYIDAVCSPNTRSVIDHATSIAAAVLLVHGAIDRREPTEQSIMLADALHAVGRHVEFVLLEGRGHSFGAVDPRRRAVAHTPIL